MNKERVRHQFGPSAGAYATSTVHAKGRSLARLVELVRPQGQWRVLDVATAAGHTAHAFAPYVDLVIATDLTFSMLTVANEQAQQRGIGNVLLAACDAEAISFADGLFDLVTCRIASHHFPDIGSFMAECARVLRPGGLLAIVDNIVPAADSNRAKKRMTPDAGQYINAFERLRDPSHVSYLTLDDWQRYYYQSGFRLLEHETLRVTLDFNDWAARMRVTGDDMIRLEAMLLKAPKPVLEFLAPQQTGSRISFDLTRVLLIGQRE